MNKTKYIKSWLIRYFAIPIAGICVFGFNADAFVSTNAPSTYANITIDGSFSDWASVPLAYAQPQIPADTVQYDSLYVANDANYLYIYFTLYTAANPFTSSQGIYIDTDSSYATGYHAHGIGSDLLVQAGNGYQETTGVFNAGTIDGLDYLEASDGSDTSYELRISLAATDHSTGDPVFTGSGSTISLYLQSTETGGNEWFPNTSGGAGGGLIYTLATTPVPEPSSLALLAFSGVFTVMAITRRRRKTTQAVSRKFPKTI